MKQNITICDICGRDCTKVDTEASSGHGSLEFTWSLGGHGGGAGDTIVKPDLCCECTQKMRAVIETAIRQIKGEQ